MLIKNILRNVIIFSWMTRLDAEESAFQCSDDVYDMKICHESVICGLRNGTVEIWNTRTMKKELSLEEQQGSVQVDANEKIGTYITFESNFFGQFFFGVILYFLYFLSYTSCWSIT